MFKFRSALVLCTALILAACSSEDDSSPESDLLVTSDPTATLDLSRGGYACYDVTTTLGEFSVALDETYAPLHAANFKQYVDNKFYNDVLFHNVISSSLIQTGIMGADLTAKTTLDPIASEAQNGLLNYRGRLVAVRELNNPDSATAGFLINIYNNPTFGYGQTSDGFGLTVFGGVIAGMDVVDAISNVEVEATDAIGYKPVEDVLITNIAAASCPATSETIEPKVIILPFPVNADDSNAAIDLTRGDYSCFSMVTSQGNIELAIDTYYAPGTSENFIQYVTDGFYDGTIFHRVMEDFMIQGGGLTADLESKVTRDPIKTESLNGLKNYRGRIAMARTSAPNSATSQFFINTVDNDFLDQSDASDGVGYTVFGGVISGMDIVDNIEDVPTSTQGGRQNVPINSITIDSITAMDCPVP